MRIRWFGQAWGAPVCDPEFRTEAPVGEPCAAGCGRYIREGEPGLVTGSLGLPEQRTFLFEVAPGVEVRACAYHVQCFAAMIGLRGTP